MEIQFYLRWKRVLGVQLLIRQKGYRSIELTLYGESFIPLATRWMSLWKDTQNLKKHAKIQTLTIASVDAVNNYTFPPLFLHHLNQYPDIKLSINAHHSNELHTLLENYSINLGYVFSQVRSPNILSTPIYLENMYLVCHKDSSYQDCINPTKLQPEDEIFLPWGQNIQFWHDEHWDSERPHLLSTRRCTTAKNLLSVNSSSSKDSSTKRDSYI